MALNQVIQTRPLDIGSEAVREFREELRGDLLLPEDDGYDAIRAVWNGMIDERPAMIARCTGAADVIAAVKFARRNEIPASVRGGGHNVAGKALTNGGLMIDLSLMKSIRVDPVDRTARVEPGVVWNELDRETQAFGLAVTGGAVSTTGIAGMTLGGGIGYLNGKFGLTCDNLLSADVVTAKGELVHASPDEHDDLFWAIRGGGGNFGIVTSFEYQLHPLGLVLAGPLLYPIERARESLRFHREFVANVPDELTVYAGFFTDPEGNKLAALVPCYAGDIEEGKRLIQPLREFGPPLADLVAPIPYTTLQTSFDEAFPPGRQNYWKSSLLPALTDEAIDTIVEYASSMTSPVSSIFIHHYHGAYSRVDSTATAYRHRDPCHDVLILAAWTDPDESDTHVSWARDFFKAMQPHVANKVFPNLLSHDEDMERIRSAYGDNYDRLVEIKDKYDPTNFFNQNQNIRPST